MNSSELARSAGVTVRTLRHYHQVGVLPEPPRATNGYREYGPEHLLHLLRIRRASTAGVPLDDVRALLADPHGTRTARLLEDLESELDAQIADLLARRGVVRGMRRGTFDPSVPAELVPLRDRMKASGFNEALLELDLDLNALLLHLVGPEALTLLTRSADLLADPDLLPTMINLTAEFERLAPSAAPSTVQHLADRCVEALAPALGELRQHSTSPAVPAPDLALLEQHLEGRLHPAQRAVIRAVTHALDRDSPPSAP